MLPRLIPEFTIKENYQAYINALQQTSYSGEIATDYAIRLTMAVDNSIYQVIPQAVIFPRSTQDIVIIMMLAHQDAFHDIQFCARGGGTSTNGQSLTAGIIIDCSKHMRNILELNLEEGWVRVQPGVVLDQLNAYLKLHDVSFAPEISPSNRATIGGMVNTDASGIGSKALGRTSDHVLDLTCVLYDGRIIHTNKGMDQALLSQQIIDLIQPHQTLINEKFTSAPRTLNGYNLKKAYTTQLNLNYLICGSEGTLVFVSECKLKLTPIPKFRKLLVVKYRSFNDALRATNMFDLVKPLAVEAIDEKLIDLARADTMYLFIKDFIDGEHIGTRAINLVEFVSDDVDELTNTLQIFCDMIDANVHLAESAIGYYVAKNSIEEKWLWELRKKSVGLISKKLEGTRRPIPFIEDTAVPPEKLADYISEFKALLDEYHLIYGMYGHVDAGCVHVRPALDMKLDADEHLVKEISDKVVKLIEKYGGVLWGEHGQGYRSEYGKQFFGDTLYSVVRHIKTLFDPFNQFNPGKIAVPMDSHGQLVKLEGPMRGQFDKQISPALQNAFYVPISCNGNGACFNYATADVMCPSYKVTQHRVQSPKGRATVMREWLRELSKKNVLLTPDKAFSYLSRLFHTIKKEPDFSHEVFSAMSGCLSCKACAGQCPLNVDVPEFKATFLSYYYQRYLRPIRDYFIGSLEISAPLQAKFPCLVNWFLNRGLTQFFLKKVIKLVSPPLVSTFPLNSELKKRDAFLSNVSILEQLSSSEKAKSVILLQDAFTSFYESDILLKTYDCLTKMGFSVYILPFFASGKPLHVKGFLKKFLKVATKNTLHLQSLATLDIPLIGIDPSITLVYRDEYQKIVLEKVPNVMLLQEWLVNVMHNIHPPVSKLDKQYYLLSHCTEKTMCVEAEKQWSTIFGKLGLNLMPLAAGCCGMAGSYGHEVEHINNSKKLFNMDWRRHLTEHSDAILATGYSCRSQVKRFMHYKVKHPIEVLEQLFI